jgi:aspartyl-tRNA(Asn)/glutamyl-tRNA(Gln) amidotransferase subunit C
MSVDKDTIRKIAHLARLEFDETEAGKMSENFNKILAWMDKLNEINTDDVQPLIHMSEEVNVLREDQANNTLRHEDALLNAPKKDSDYFRVPKFLG